MKSKLLAVMLLGGGSMFAQTQFSAGVNIGGGYVGGYYQQDPYAYAPPCPAPYYTWVNGVCVEDYGYVQPYYGGYYSGGYYNRSYRIAPRFEGRFDNRYDRGYRDNDRSRRSFVEPNRSRGFEQNRNSGGQNRSQSFGSSQGRSQGRSQGGSQGGGNRGGSSRGSSGGSRGR